MTVALTDLPTRLNTVVAITVTPFDASGAVDGAAYTRVVARMVEAGITAITPNGNTSEFYSLGDAEVSASLEATMKAVTDDVVVIPGVGHEVSRAVRMAQAAERGGAHGVMVHQPVHPYRSTQGWVDYHRAVAEGAPSLGLVAYVRDPRITAEALAQLAEACPTLVAVKFAVPDPFALPLAIEAVGAARVAWVCGLAERWAPFHWVGGARGFTSGLANVSPELSLELLRHLRAGATTEAMDVWRRVWPMEEMRARRGDANNVSALKEALAHMGLTSRAVRPPVSDLPPEEQAEVVGILASWGIATAAA
jgi:4-hydroxy-tetrahydrodipicolinate synthase